MEGLRSYYQRNKPRIILNKTFPIFKELNVGDKGILRVSGIIEEERLEQQEDGSEYFIKVIKISKTELIENKATRYD